MVYNPGDREKFKEKYIEYKCYYSDNACLKKDTKVLLLQIVIC
jgi:hypothetical protein